MTNERDSQGDQEGLHTAARVLPPPSHQEGPLGSLMGHFYSSFSVLSSGRNEKGEVLSFFKFTMTFKITSLSMGKLRPGVEGLLPNFLYWS